MCSSALQCPDLAKATDRSMVDEDVGHRLASREARKPGAQLGVAGSVNHLEAVSTAHEEASGEPAAPGAAADVDQHLFLIVDHGFSYLLSPSKGNLTGDDESAVNLAARHAPRRLIHPASGKTDSQKFA
jgi:hypothetical protein